MVKRVAVWVALACLSIATAFSAVAVAQPPKAADPVVYVTNTGEKYHADGCRYLKKSKKPLRLSEAKERGYSPCSVCNPPK